MQPAESLGPTRPREFHHANDQAQTQPDTDHAAVRPGLLHDLVTSDPRCRGVRWKLSAKQQP